MGRLAISEGNSETSSFVSLFLKFFLNYSCNQNSANYMLIIEPRSCPGSGTLLGSEI